jgi:rubrerythrin
MNDKNMANIPMLCRSLENKAFEIYSGFADHFTASSDKLFWREIALDEKRHIEYWDELIELNQAGKLPSVFDNEEKTRTELSMIEEEMAKLFDRQAEITTSPAAIRAALKIEASMLHPAFAILFRSISVKNGRPTPGDDYAEHIAKFRDYMKQIDPHNMEWALLGETLSMMWMHNLQLADYVAQIKTLQGFIPICASCKKIRDTEGVWQKLEDYIGQHSEAKFSHSMCPDCQIKFYPEIYAGRNL